MTTDITKLLIFDLLLSLEESCQSQGLIMAKLSKVPYENYLLWTYQQVFPDNILDLEGISDYYEGEAGDELFDLVDSGDPESGMRLAFLLCQYDDDSIKAPAIADTALTSAKKSKLDLGRYWFTLGAAFHWNENFEAAKFSFEKSFECDFGPAALPLGELVLIEDANLKSAVRIWKSGVKDFGIKECEVELKKREVEPGVYKAVVKLKDGTSDIIVVMDR